MPLKGSVSMNYFYPQMLWKQKLLDSGVSMLRNNFQMSFAELELPAKLFLLSKTEQVSTNY